MTSLSFILLGAVCVMFAPQASAMECSAGGLVTFNCPNIITDDDKVFCCGDPKGLQHCCDIEEFMQTYTGLIAGIIVASVIVVIVITLCCCCFCSCCCLFKRRVNRGHVLYGPVGGAQVVTTSAPAYQLAQPSPATTVYTHSPPPYNPTYDASQPPVNPYYK